MSALVLRYLRDESGATAIEYGLIALLVSVGIVGGVTATGDNLKDLFQRIVSGITAP